MLYFDKKLEFNLTVNAFIQRAKCDYILNVVNICEAKSSGRELMGERKHVNTGLSS